jgi:hypothetical protein
VYPAGQFITLKLSEGLYGPNIQRELGFFSPGGGVKRSGRDVYHSSSYSKLKNTWNSASNPSYVVMASVGLT